MLHYWSITNKELSVGAAMSDFGGLAFPVAGPTVSNDLLDSVTSAVSPSTCRRRPKTVLSLISFSGIIPQGRLIFHSQWIPIDKRR